MPLAIAVYEIGTSSIIILLYLFMLFLVLDLGRLLHLLPRTLFYNNWWTVGGIALGMFVLFLYGYLHYQHKHREELHLTTEKQLSKPLKIVAMSDLHIGYHNRRSELHRWVDATEFDRQEKIQAVTALYNEIGIRQLCEEKINYYFEQARQYLAYINVPQERKQPLIDFTNEMMHRDK